MAALHAQVLGGALYVAAVLLELAPEEEGLALGLEVLEGLGSEGVFGARLRGSSRQLGVGAEDLLEVVEGELGALSSNDRRFLRSLRIAADEPSQQPE